MKHFYSHDGLRKAMDEQGAEVLAGGQAEFFLGGQAGTAWILTALSTKYVVSLREDALCAVFAQRAESGPVQSGFASLVSSAPEPLVARKLKDPALGTTSGSTKTAAYSWGRPEDQTELVFTLTTSDDSNVTAQAMASMTLTKKTN